MDVEYTFECKADTANKWRTYHYHKCASITRKWKDAFFWLAKSNPQAFIDPVDIVVYHETKGRLPDVGSCMHNVKAAIDGLVLAGILPDDNPKYLRSLRFMAPVKTGRDALTLHIETASNEG